MNTHIKLGMKGLNSSQWNPEHIESIAKKTAKDIVNICAPKIQEKAKEKEKKKETLQKTAKNNKTSLQKEKQLQKQPKKNNVIKKKSQTINMPKCIPSKNNVHLDEKKMKKTTKKKKSQPGRDNRPRRRR